MYRAFFCLCLLAACAVDHTGLMLRDAATPDTGMDGGPNADTALPDARMSDGGGFDAGGAPDTAPIFDGGVDARPVDVGMDAPMPDAGPMDVGTDADPCTTGPDADEDGVSDACDRCPGEDDRIDVDEDEIPDGCDPWPCTELPTPADPITSEFITISNARLGEGGNRAVVRSGDSVRVRFDWFIDDDGCSSCTDQIELGTQRGRLACVYNDVPPPAGDAGSFDNPLMVEGPPRVIELRFNLGQNFSCDANGADDWWPAAPTVGNNFALICVR